MGTADQAGEQWCCWFVVGHGMRGGALAAGSWLGMACVVAHSRLGSWKRQLRFLESTRCGAAPSSRPCIHAVSWTTLSCLKRELWARAGLSGLRGQAR